MTSCAALYRCCLVYTAIIVLLTAGCHGTYRAYPGLSQTSTAVATLRGEGWLYNLLWLTDCDLLAVDGQSLGLWDERAEVLPGRHTVRLQLWEHDLDTDNTQYLYCDGELEVLAGLDYRFRVSRQGLPAVIIVTQDGVSVTSRPLDVYCRERLIELELAQRGTVK
jgi:hypothetical protein